MQFKPLPVPPDTLDRLERIRRSLPREAAPEVDCCSRVIEQTDVGERDVAGEWIVFLRALDLASNDAEGYRRTETRIDPHRLGTAFRERIVDVDAVLAELESADVPVDADTLRARVNRSTTTGERTGFDSRDDPDRVRRILEWAELFDLIERVDDGFRSV